MIEFAKGNLLDADVEALVNAVNCVGVMGKGIALMMKERFPLNFEAYERACEAGEVRIGEMFVTESEELPEFGHSPRWIINFPTKDHWRSPTKIEWVEEGLKDLVRVIREKDIRSIAIPPLGCGNGGLDWGDVRPLIVSALEELEGVETIIYEPTAKYQNVSKRSGVEKLTPARALMAEMVRRYCVLGDCSVLEVQKLAWFLERGIKRFLVDDDPLKLSFQADRYGPYSHRLTKLLENLDGSYLHCGKRLTDAGPYDLIWFDDSKRKVVEAYLGSGEGKRYSDVLKWASDVIDGFESPFGMELLATVDWLLQRDGIEASVEGVMDGLRNWTGGKGAGERKLNIFDERVVRIALDRLEEANH